MKASGWIGVALLSVLAACSKHDEASQGATQVVAKVNGSEITVHQLNLALSKLGKLEPAQVKPASEKLLRQMVDLELLKQKSIDEKLDRDPNVLQLIEANRQQLLAQAYMQKVAAKQLPPTSDEIKAFFDTHPELFSERNLYLIQEFAVQEGAARLAEIQAGIEHAKSAEEIAQWLQSHGFKFNVNTLKKAAEQLPLELLAKLNKLQVNDTLAVNNGQALVLLFLAKVERQPVDLNNAQPVIKQYLLNAGQQQRIKETLDTLRKEAKIQLMGDFAKLSLDAAATPAAASAPVATSAATPVAEMPTTIATPAQPEAAATPPKSGQHQAINRGLSGL